jgi:hypothetical protein
VHSSPVNGLTIHEGRAGSDGDGIDVVSVHEIEVVNVRGVHDVHVADEGVVHVNALCETTAAVEPREERLTKAEREPADASTEANAKPKVCAAIEAYERRTIDWSREDGSRAPAPSSADECPAAIVERRKAPRCVVDPGPTPRTDIVPIAPTVGRPADCDCGGIPDWTILGLLAPGAVIVEVGVAGNVAGDILRRRGAILAQVAISGPAIQAVRRGSGRRVVLDILHTLEFCLLARVKAVGLSVGGDFALAANHRDARGVAIFGDVNAEGASLFYSERKIWRVDFIEVAFAQLADAEIHGAFREAQLHNVFVKVEERNGSHAANMDGRLANLELNAGIFVAPNFVADCHRAIFCSGAPIPGAARLKGYAAIEKANARDARRGITWFRAGIGLVSADLACDRNEKEESSEPYQQSGFAATEKCGIHGITPVLGDLAERSRAYVCWTLRHNLSSFVAPRELNTQVEKKLLIEAGVNWLAWTEG